jgi:hypothetical protein
MRLSIPERHLVPVLFDNTGPVRCPTPQRQRTARPNAGKWLGLDCLQQPTRLLIRYHQAIHIRVIEEGSRHIRIGVKKIDALLGRHPLRVALEIGLAVRTRSDVMQRSSKDLESARLIA